MFRSKVLIPVSVLLTGSLIVVSFFISGQSAMAQSANPSSLRLRVVDPSGAAIDGAEVKLISKDGQELTAKTNQRGEAVFSNLKTEAYQLHVEANGFQSRDIPANQLTNLNQLEVKLEVAKVAEEITVQQDKQEKATDPRGNGFSTILTAEQIAQLPDDPDEMEARLRDMAGPGAVIRVNGFRGGKLPPKSQISQIKFRLNPYSADLHEAGFIGIDISTKPGIENWHGSLNFGYRGQALDARNAFAQVKGPEQFRRFSGTLDIPLFKHTALFLASQGADAYDSKTIVAALPTGDFFGLIQRPLWRLNSSARLEHQLTKNHVLMMEYQNNVQRQDNLGAGDFDLAARAYSNDTGENIFRLSDNGTLGKAFVNEFRFQARWQSLDSHSATNAPAILVLNAFNQGGAQVQNSQRSHDFEAADNLDFSVKNNALRTGFLLEGGQYRSNDLSNRFGTFIFPSLDLFLKGQPSTFTQRSGNGLIDFQQYQFGAYFLDDIRLKKNLTLSVGAREELQSNLGDHWNIAPRVGIAWSPGKSGKTTVRAGAGLFYDWLGTDTVGQVLRVNGLQQLDTIVNNPGFPDPFANGSRIVLPPSRIQEAALLRMPYIEQESIGVEKQPAPWLRINTTYFHQHGVNLFRGVNINAAIPGFGRPDPTSGVITQLQSSADSFDDRLIVNVNLTDPKRRFFGAFNYQLGRSIGETDSQLGLPADSLNPKADRGPTSFDARHRLFAIGNMDLMKGLHLAAVFHIFSATPYNITTGRDNNGDGVSNDRPLGVGRNSARGAGQWDLDPRLSWTRGFGKPVESAGAGPQVKIIRRTSGDDSPVPTLSGRNINNHYKMEFYLQAYNVFNHTNPISFSGVLTSPFFGQPIAALQGRRFESGVRVSF